MTSLACLAGEVFYFWAKRSRAITTKRYMALGNHAPQRASKPPLMLKVSENLDMIMNRAPMPAPSARCKPIPPRILRLLRLIPIRVRMSTVPVSALRRCFSEAKSIFSPAPRCI